MERPPLWDGVGWLLRGMALGGGRCRVGAWPGGLPKARLPALGGLPAMPQRAGVGCLLRGKALGLVWDAYCVEKRGLWFAKCNHIQDAAQVI